MPETKETGPGGFPEKSDNEGGLQDKQKSRRWKLSREQG